MNGKPKQLQDLILAKQVRAKFEDLVEEGIHGNILVVGATGTGKTSLVRCLMNELKVPKEAMLWLSAACDRSFDKLTFQISTFSQKLTESPKYIVLDDIDVMSHRSQQAVLTNMGRCRLLSMCTDQTKVCDELQSKSCIVKLVHPGVRAIEEHLKSLCNSLQKKACARIAALCRGDVRRAVQYLKTVEVLGMEYLDEIDDACTHADAIIGACLQKDFQRAVQAYDEMRSLGYTSEDICRAMFNALLTLNTDEDMKLQMLKVVGETCVRVHKVGNDSCQLLGCIAHVILNLSSKVD